MNLFENDYDDEYIEKSIEIFVIHVIKNFNLRWSINNKIPAMTLSKIEEVLYDEFNHCINLQKYAQLKKICYSDVLFSICFEFLRVLYGYY